MTLTGIFSTKHTQILPLAPTPLRLGKVDSSAWRLPCYLHVLASSLERPRSAAKTPDSTLSQNLLDGELDALIRDVFPLSMLTGVPEFPTTSQTPTGCGSPPGGCNTPHLDIRTNGTGFSTPNSHRGISVMNAYPKYPPTSSHTDLPVQVLLRRQLLTS